MKTRNIIASVLAVCAVLVITEAQSYGPNVLPFFGVAQGTSIALGGCTIGTGGALCASNTTTNTARFNSTATNGPDIQLQNSGTTFLDLTTAAGNFSTGFVGGTTDGSINSRGNHLILGQNSVGLLQIDGTGFFFGGGAATVTGTGTPAIASGSTDTAGEVTSGTAATSVVIHFSATKTNAPFCTVTPQTQLVAFSYTISTALITITQTATTGEKIDYVCGQH